MHAYHCHRSNIQKAATSVLWTTDKTLLQNNSKMTSKSMKPPPWTHPYQPFWVCKPFKPFTYFTQVMLFIALSTSDTSTMDKSLCLLVGGSTVIQIDVDALTIRPHALKNCTCCSLLVLFRTLHEFMPTLRGSFLSFSLESKFDMFARTAMSIQ